MCTKVTCDKCGQVVNPDNDATIFWSFVVDDPTEILNKPRHLLPTETCEGSPSRAQYLIGQPRDSRGYEYDEKEESLLRAAYEKYQEWAKCSQLNKK